jgi:hypothetical protein
MLGCLCREVTAAASEVDRVGFVMDYEARSVEDTEVMVVVTLLAVTTSNNATNSFSPSNRTVWLPGVVEARSSPPAATHASPPRTRPQPLCFTSAETINVRTDS